MSPDFRPLTFKKALGNTGEKLVADFLHNLGFKILERNYSIRGGEIDIIAQKKDLISFVEVKTRSTDYFSLSEIITPSKQRKIIFTAQHFIMHKKITDCILRFDVALLIKKSDADFKIEFIENAFAPMHNAY